MAQKSNKCAKVIEALKSVMPNFNVHTDDLNKPTPVIVCKFYEKMLDELGVDIDKMMMTLTQHLSSPDAYQDILQCYVLYRCSRGIFERLNMKSVTQPFRISDILRPTPTVTKIRVMMISNFLCYANNLIAATLRPIENRLREKLVELDVMHKELDELGTKTNTLAMESIELAKDQDKIQKDIDESLGEYVKQKEIHNKILEENDNLKSKDDELQAERTRLMEILRKELAKDNELKQLLVEDHVTIAAERERLEKELANEESYKTDHALNLNTKNDSEQKYHTFTTVVDEFLEQEHLDYILELYAIQDTMKMSVEKMKEKLQGLHTFQTDFHSNMQKMQEDTDSLQEELQALQVQLYVKEPVLQQEIQRLETEHNELASKQKRNDDRADEFQQKIQHAIECCAQHERNVHELNEFHQKEYERILQNTGDLHNKVDHNLKEIQIKAEQINHPFLQLNDTN